MMFPLSILNIQNGIEQLLRQWSCRSIGVFDIQWNGIILSFPSNPIHWRHDG